jgi:hypothetical protein
LNKIIIVATDQLNDDSVSERDKGNDTVHYAAILKRKLQKEIIGSTVMIISVTSNVVDPDNMYTFFEKKIQAVKEHAPSDHIFVQAQGGIDAINTAILLQVTLNFSENNITHLTKPVSSPISLPSDFPSKFNASLKNKIYKSSLDKYDFLPIMEIEGDNSIGLLAQIAVARFHLNFEDYNQIIQKAIAENPKIRVDIAQMSNVANECLTNPNKRLVEWYLATKILFAQGDYNSFLVRMFSISESLLKIHVCNSLGLNFDLPHNEFKTSLIDKINQIPDLKTHLESKKFNGEPIKLDANKGVFNYILIFLKAKNELFTKITDGLKPLSDLRNQIAHNMSSTNLNVIESKMATDSKLTISNLFELMDQYFGVIGFGDYDKLRNLILKVSV